MLRFDSQPAYVLHARPYQETSLLLEFFTQDFGRVSAIAKGAKRPKSRGRGLLQPFIPLLISCAGKGELLTVKDFDAAAPPILLLGRRLIFAFYLNELLMRLLHRADAHDELFYAYEKSLHKLREDNDEHLEQVPLRLFEKTLLKELGYELHLTHEVDSGKPLNPDSMYFFDPEKGPILLQTKVQAPALALVQVQTQEQTLLQPELQSQLKLQSHLAVKSDLKAIFKGSSLLALAEELLTEKKVLQDARRLMRLALSGHLGNRPLESRRLL